jgi:hypothetical protein
MRYTQSLNVQIKALKVPNSIITCFTEVMVKVSSSAYTSNKNGERTHIRNRHSQKPQPSHIAQSSNSGSLGGSLKFTLL